MREPSYSGQFRRDVRRAEKRGKDMTKLRHVLRMLIEGAPLPARLRDHPLKSDWIGYRDLHIEPNWLLIYKADATNVHFERTGTHSNLLSELGGTNMLSCNSCDIPRDAHEPGFGLYLPPSPRLYCAP